MQSVQMGKGNVFGTVFCRMTAKMNLKHIFKRAKHQHTPQKAECCSYKLFSRKEQHTDCGCHLTMIWMCVLFTSRVTWETKSACILEALQFKSGTFFFFKSLTLTLLMWRIWWAPNNASRWQMGFNWVFTGLNFKCKACYRISCIGVKSMCCFRYLLQGPF